MEAVGTAGKNSHHTSYDADGIKQHNRCGSYYPITTDQAFVQNQTPNNGTLAVAEDESKVKKVITCLQSRPHVANVNVGTSTVSIHLANLEQLDQYIFNGKPQIDSKINRNPPRNGLPQKLGRAKERHFSAHVKVSTKMRLMLISIGLKYYAFITIILTQSVNKDTIITGS
ncbi:hypothetical protein GQX74_014392 [Glossina fuscipes]|nr:hypothetical protein GQX74_014392 [Glossina fuscipes]